MSRRPLSISLPPRRSACHSCWGFSFIFTFCSMLVFVFFFSSVCMCFHRLNPRMLVYIKTIRLRNQALCERILIERQQLCRLSSDSAEGRRRVFFSCSYFMCPACTLRVHEDPSYFLAKGGRKMVDVIVFFFCLVAFFCSIFCLPLFGVIVNLEVITAVEFKV